MKNVSLDCTTVLQLYTHRTDGALNAAADCDILRNHAAIDRRAIADQEIGSAQLAFDSAEDLCWTFAFDLAYDDMPEPMRESGPDFVVVGSGPDATCSTTVRGGCSVFPMGSSAFAAVFLSGSGALLLKLFNMLASPCGLNVSATRELRPATRHQTLPCHKAAQ